MGFAELVGVLFLVGVNSLDLVSAPDFDFSAVATHVIRVLAVLRQAVSKGGPYT